jgi:hypothetical protein
MSTLTNFLKVNISGNCVPTFCPPVFSLFGLAGEAGKVWVEEGRGFLKKWVWVGAVRMESVKKAADAAGRKIAFIGMSLNTYLEAAMRDGRAPIDPRELVPPSQIDACDPNELLIVTTGERRCPDCLAPLCRRIFLKQFAIKRQ